MRAPLALALAVTAATAPGAPAARAEDGPGGDGRAAEYWDRRDLYGLVGLGTAKRPPHPERFVPYLTAVPVIGYTPASGLLGGLAGTVGMLLGRPEDTTISSATAALCYSSSRQLTLSLASTAMTAGNSWELLGDWRLLLFNQDTYGLGTGGAPLGGGFSLSGLGDLSAASGAQPMDFDLLRFRQSALRHVAGSLYLGAGFWLDRYARIVDRRLDLSATPPVLTSHEAYSRVQGFDPGAYTASGLGVEALSDSRDSTIAPYRGWYAHLRFAGYPTWLGSTQASTTLTAEGRAYLGLSDADPRNLLALWVIASGVTSGRVPYLALPSTGWDARSTSGRGYVQGRFRGTSWAYAEAEWRFRLRDDGLLGGTVFASAQTFSRPAVSLPQYGYAEPGERLFDAVRPALGLGFRVMLMRQSRTALRIDLAAGQDSLCFYFGAGEAF